MIRVLIGFKLPPTLHPLQGKSAATLNNATRGYDVGQAGQSSGIVALCTL